MIVARIHRSLEFPKAAVDLARILSMSDGTPLTEALRSIDVFIPKSTAAFGNSSERCMRATIMKL